MAMPPTQQQDPAKAAMSAQAPSSFAASDLGLGAQLQQQMSDLDEERKRKALGGQQSVMDTGNSLDTTGMSPAVMSLFSKAV